jgi:diacylglycerol kinase family enzyme
MPRIDVIFNPTAGKLRQNSKLILRLEQILKDQGKVVVTKQKGDLNKFVSEIGETNSQIIAICGGDGTNLFVLTQLYQEYNQRIPQILFLPGGTWNTTAKNLGIYGSPERILKRIIEFPNRISSQKIGTISVNNNIGFIFGGLFAGRFFKEYYQISLSKITKVLFLGIKIFLSALLGTSYSSKILSSQMLKIKVDGKDLDLNAWRLIMASMIKKAGCGIQITYRGGERKDAFHFIASNIPPRALSLQILKVLQGRPLSGEPHLDTFASSVLIKASLPIPFILDGELFEAKEIKIETGPNLEIIIPPK